MATLELKSCFKQSLENAKQQYRFDRPLVTAGKREPLLAFRRGALVHFAVNQFEVAMTTRLAGADTFFLPFNRGTAKAVRGTISLRQGSPASTYGRRFSRPRPSSIFWVAICICR